MIESFIEEVVLERSGSLALEGDILGWENQGVKNTEVGVKMIWSDRFGFPKVLL